MILWETIHRHGLVSQDFLTFKQALDLGDHVDAKKSGAAHELCAEEPFLVKPYELDFAVAHIRQTLDSRKNSG